MKLYKSFLAVAAVMLCACSGKAKSEAVNTQAEAPAKEKTILVAYFSCTNTTRKVAEKVAEAKDADLFEIVPAQKYTAADLDWTDQQSRSSLEMKEKSSRPAIESKVENFSQYNKVYIGFPVWWYTAPTIINTFLEQYDWTGKTVVLFATSGGSDIQNVPGELTPSAPGAVFEGAFLLNGDPSVDTVKEILK